MCGICGIFGYVKSAEKLRATVWAMTDALNHRGPDAKGVWIGSDSIGFGHARLSIIDLSESGSQPMHSKDGRYTICYNGEIYNYRDLKDLLDKEGITLRGQSDTEVLVECIARWGIDWAIERAHGMFAIALWDNHLREMTLIRDRFGEKPLYYGLIGRVLVFSSELHSFRKHPDFEFNVDSKALSAFVKYNYVPSPLCILKGFKKLPAGSKISGKHAKEFFEKSPITYWNATKANHATACSIDEFENQLRSVVSRQMLSDVPLGCFLSGGVDSSLITAIAQQQLSTPIDTFTIGFNETDFDESIYAAKVAKHLGTNHTEWIINQTDVLDLIPKVGQTYDEPFGDSSQLPTMLLSQMTRQEVTVCLSGDGGDEMFGGYTRYDWAQNIDRWVRRIPRPIKRGLNWAYKRRDVGDWVSTYHKLEKLFPVKFNHVGDKFEKISGLLEGQSGQEYLYETLLTHWLDPTKIVVKGVDYSHVTGSFLESYSFMET